MKENLLAKVDDFIHQGSNWQHDLIYELIEIKIAFGAEGTKNLLAEKLAKYNRNSLPKGSYLMRLVTVAEKLGKLCIPRSISDQLPLPHWMKLLKYVTHENAQEMVGFLHHQDGELKLLVLKLKQGYNLRYNLFSGDYEFIK